MARALRVLRSGSEAPEPAVRSAGATPPEEVNWLREREELFEMLAHQQRVAQAGLMIGNTKAIRIPVSTIRITSAPRV